MHAIAAKAVCFKEAMTDEYKAYQTQVIKNAKAMAQTIISRGYDVVSGGTENHLMLISLIKQEITGKEADKWLGDAHITVNKNAVPNDPKSPFVTSGIRLGTPAVTTRGFKEAECIELAGWICDILDAKGDEKVIAEVRDKVAEVCKRLPVYQHSKTKELFAKISDMIDEQADSEFVNTAKEKFNEFYEKAIAKIQK